MRQRPERDGGQLCRPEPQPDTWRVDTLDRLIHCSVADRGNGMLTDLALRTEACAEYWLTSPKQGRNSKDLAAASVFLAEAVDLTAQGGRRRWPAAPVPGCRTPAFILVGQQYIGMPPRGQVDVRNLPEWAQDAWAQQDKCSGRAGLDSTVTGPPEAQT